MPQLRDGPPRKYAVRDPLDRDYTPAAVAEALVSRIPLPRSTCALEPAAGGLAIARPLAQRFDTVITNDVDPASPADGCCDFLAPSFYGGGDRFDLIVTNPPFNLAEAFLRQSLALADHVVFLIRVGFLGSRKRAPLWELYPADGIKLFTPRPGFRHGAGTDMTEYVAAFWGWGPGTIAFEHLDYTVPHTSPATGTHAASVLFALRERSIDPGRWDCWPPEVRALALERPPLAGASRLRILPSLARGRVASVFKVLDRLGIPAYVDENGDVIALVASWVDRPIVHIHLWDQFGGRV